MKQKYIICEAPNNYSGTGRLVGPFAITEINGRNTIRIAIRHAGKSDTDVFVSTEHFPQTAAEVWEILHVIGLVEKFADAAMEEHFQTGVSNGERNLREKFAELMGLT